MKKAFKIHLPDYLTVDMFKQISTYDGNDIGKMINVISAMIGLPISTVKQYPVDLIRQVGKDLEALALPQEQFHPLIEFNGQLYGYSDIHSMNLGCFVDLEEYLKDADNNLNKIASILYRPITKNRFNSLEYQIKQGIRIGFEKGIENPFDYYEIETYDSEVVKDRWEEMNDFPSHILLGALSFFLAAASLYMNDTAYSGTLLEEKIQKKTIDSTILTALSHLTGGGGQPFTDYLNPVSFQSPEISL
jgi:hypothetical protein